MRKLRLLPLVAATFFMVSGGPYGLEDAIGHAGYGPTLLLLLLVPLFWSLPTALMVGELAGAMPQEGGFYVWVTRALGPFWGFQEAWLSLAASLFDMALYPVLAVTYLAQLSPVLTAGHRGLFLSLLIIVFGAVWNLKGASAVGQSSIWFSVLLVLPFLVVIALGVFHAFAPRLGHGSLQPLGTGGLETAVLVILWNYMGWDNASTIAREVEQPQRIYTRAMLLAVSLVAGFYIAAVAAAAFGGVPASRFVTGDWVNVARLLAGDGTFSQILGIALVITGALTGIAMFNALTLSYARIPAALATDGFLPRLFARHSKKGVPYVSVILCCFAWASLSGWSFEGLLKLDLLLYGLSLALEFAALIALRIHQPDLPRPYRIPGPFPTVIAISACPLAIIGWVLFNARHEFIVLGSRQMPLFLLVAMIVASGVFTYGAVRFWRGALPRSS